jgi:hypothetical protein
MIRNLSSDQSREALAAAAIFEEELRATLRDFPWPFATVYATPVLVGGTASVRLNADWQYSYRLPSDAVFTRRIVTAAGRAFERYPPSFKLGQDATGALLYTDVAAPVLEYTTRPADAVRIADPLFREAFGWRLAAALAPSLAQVDPPAPEQIGRGPEDPAAPKDRPSSGIQLRQRVAQGAWAMYQQALAQARVAAATEGQPDLVPGEADWIVGRD